MEEILKLTAEYAWIFGLGIMFGLTFFLTILLKGNIKVFFGILIICSGIVVYGGLLDSWVFILCTIGALLITFYDRNMGLIGITLTIIIVLTILSVISGGDFASGTAEGGLTNELIVNGTTSTIQYEEYDTTFGIDPLTGAIALLIIIIAIASIIGLQIFGSGLSDTSVRAIRSAIMYIGLWSTFSLLALPLIFDIAIYGSIIYVILTIGYAIGVYKQISEG